MGQALEVVCFDCKEVYYIGYGRPDKTEYYAEVVKAHDGHNHKNLWTDYLRVRGNDLVNDHPYTSDEEDEVVVPDYVNFTYIKEPNRDE